MKLINGRRPGAAAAGALFLLLLIFFPAHEGYGQDVEPDAPTGRTDARPRSRDGDLVQLLNLTPEQIEKIRDIREGNREARRRIGQRIRAARMALDRSIYDENADEMVVEQRARELSEAQAEQVRLQALVELDIRRILTTEQLQIFRALRTRAESRRRGRRLGRRQDESGTTDALRPARRRRPRL